MLPNIWVPMLIGLSRAPSPGHPPLAIATRLFGRGQSYWRSLDYDYWEESRRGGCPHPPTGTLSHYSNVREAGFPHPTALMGPLRHLLLLQRLWLMSGALGEGHHPKIHSCRRNPALRFQAGEALLPLG